MTKNDIFLKSLQYLFLVFTFHKHRVDEGILSHTATLVLVSNALVSLCFQHQEVKGFLVNHQDVSFPL